MSAALAVAMVYNPMSEDRSRWVNPAVARTSEFQARYLAGLEGQEALGDPLRKQAVQVGMDRTAYAPVLTLNAPARPGHARQSS
jgi:hypothetical protein